MRKLATIILCALAASSYAQENMLIAERVDSPSEKFPLLRLKSVNDYGGVIFVDQTSPNTAEISLDHTANGVFRIVNDQDATFQLLIGNNATVASVPRVLQLAFIADDSGGNEEAWGGATVSITDRNNGTEDATLILSTRLAGASPNLSFDGTVLLPSSDDAVDLGSAASGFRRLYTETGAQFNFGTPSVSAFALSSSTSGDLIWVARSAIVSGLGEYFVRRAGTGYGVGDPEIDGLDSATLDWQAAWDTPGVKFLARDDTPTLTVSNSYTGSAIRAATALGDAIEVHAPNSLAGVRVYDYSGGSSYPEAAFYGHGELNGATLFGGNYGVVASGGIYGLWSLGAALIDGEANTTQLTVRGHTTQGTNYILIEDSTGTDLLWLSSAGLLTNTGSSSLGDASGDTHTFTGSTLHNGRSWIDGTADEVQLNVQANGTQTSDIAIFESSAGTDFLNIGPPSLAVGGTDNWLLVTGTMPSNSVAAQNGIYATVTGADNEAFAQRTAYFEFLDGYSGSNEATTIFAQMSDAGAGAAPFTPAANMAVRARANGTSTSGVNIAYHARAASGDVNYGLFSDTTAASATKDNIAVAGFGLNASGGIRVGGFFGLMNSVPTYPSVALGSDNGATTDPIFMARDNGTATFTIADAGTVTSTGIHIFTPSATQAITAVGNTILANAHTIALNPDANYTLTSTPTIADGTTGQLLYITCPNGEANAVTVQDEGTLAGSNIQLNTAVTTRTVGDLDRLVLEFNGTYWCEVSYSDN